MERTIVRIDRALCDGCGICVEACHEGAIGLIDGKARLLGDECCDGMGDCLPQCPQGAISFEEREAAAYAGPAVKASELRQWPVEIKLVNPDAACFDDASLLVAADCTAFAYAPFHRDFIRGRATVVGCPKLDGVDYAGKLAAICLKHAIRDILIARMEVPCCGGLEAAVVRAVQGSGKDIPVHVAVISIDGGPVERRVARPLR